MSWASLSFAMTTESKWGCACGRGIRDTRYAMTEWPSMDGRSSKRYRDRNPLKHDLLIWSSVSFSAAAHWRCVIRCFVPGELLSCEEDAGISRCVLCTYVKRYRYVKHPGIYSLGSIEGGFFLILIIQSYHIPSSTSKIFKQYLEATT